MHGYRKHKDLFIAGFGRYRSRRGRKSQALQGGPRHPLQEETDAIFIRKLLEAQKVSPCGRFLRRRSPVLARSWPDDILHHKRGLSLTLTASNGTAHLESRGYRDAYQEQERTMGQPLVVSSHRWDCWSA